MTTVRRVSHSKTKHNTPRLLLEKIQMKSFFNAIVIKVANVFLVAVPQNEFSIGAIHVYIHECIIPNALE